MRGPLGDRIYAALARLRRLERRELRALRRWVERTSNLVHLSVLAFVPLLIAVVTLLFNSIEQLSFLLFPPLASGTYTLFADPEGKYASPTRFVAGLTAGALCGWAALGLASALGLGGGGAVAGAAAEGLTVGAFQAAVAVLLAGASTWALDVEEPSAYSTALLGLLVSPGDQPVFALSVLLASSVVALVFVVWRERFYDRRAQFLYESTGSDDHVLVPMRGDDPDATAMLGARLAAAHDAGKVVLLDVVDDEAVASAERDLLDEGRRADRAVTDGGRDDHGDPVSDGGDASGNEDGPSDDTSGDRAEERAVAAAAAHLEDRASEIETRVGVPCEVVVAVGGRSRAATVLQTARETNCDLVAAAYEQRYGALTPYIHDLFRGDIDVIVHRSAAGRTRWKRVLVPVRRASDVAHSMLDFARRLVGRSGRISVCSCVSGERERRRAEAMLADLVEAFDGGFETRVAVETIERYLADNADEFDLLFMGASTDRSAASRLISPPTFERIQDLDADVVIVDRS
ncbi:HPP family protein [Halosimplex pelagicum]|uniref:HPP family protein n=1 Tax=Halosimplex pelagicum TaxID=869886 RepID=A0A7D5P6I5_9EURY|nr:HPP family protein [Halosimplex pelagicum]QLH80381.1 HPP family protein [Halosimplex pelagicum]